MKKICSLFVMVILSLSVTCNVFAVNTVPTAEQNEAADQRKLITVESNLVNGWPEGPIIGAQSAILVDAYSGMILYEKNVNDRLYPASTTKLMTALLTIENTAMNDVVTFSHDAIHNIESSSSRIGIDEGEELTVEQCLYGLLLGSGNEVAYALAEHVAGDVDSFVAMMNERAAELGCTNTHFVNPNGLPDPEHYVSALDLSIIARACFKNESLVTISGTAKYTIPPTNKQPEERPLENHHLMVGGLKYAYDGFVGGKTGYTKDARQTLVTCAEREGMRLICVILKEESPNQFLDTAALFDYGFDCFKKLNISENEKKYTLNSATFFNTDLDIIGSSKPILVINRDNYVIIPKTCGFEDLNVSVYYEDVPANAVALLKYDFNTREVGEALIEYADIEKKVFEFSNVIRYATMDEIPRSLQPEKNRIFVNVERVVIILGITAAVIIFGFFIKNLITGYMYSSRRRTLKVVRKRYKKRRNVKTIEITRPVDNGRDRDTFYDDYDDRL
ncbi:MAG: D-alanyl-D-alanine carboxypeptidase [Lachnospiraceae bacterium]|nr:D-alanyl-D-alanine carboxypeptidase [Lachnospiraceae bacterium]